MFQLFIPSFEKSAVNCLASINMHAIEYIERVIKITGSKLKQLTIDIRFIYIIFFSMSDCTIV